MTPTSLRKVNISSHRFGRTATAALSLAIVFAMAIVVMSAAQAQTFTVIHTFTGADGAYPQAGLTMDGTGNFYGTAGGGSGRGYYCDGTGCGTVFHLSNGRSGWLLTPLYDFQGTDGLNPSSRAVLAQDGTLYGVTNQGGPRGNCQFGCGTVYELTPAASALAPWQETVIHYFTIDDGWYPLGDPAFDQAGNLYVTVLLGGPLNHGLVYQFTPLGSGWIGTIIYSFQGLRDGAGPSGGVVVDTSGNLYGIAEGGPNAGVVYELSPSGSSWTEQAIYAFTGGSDGGGPYGGLTIDSSGNLYGRTALGGDLTCNPPNGCGTVFKLTPGEGGWVFKSLYGFSFYNDDCCALGGKVSMDAAGNLYGTTIYGGAYGAGTVFKLTSGINGWTFTSLHDFTGESGSDGAYPTSTLAIEENGNLYGTASEGGTYNLGTVFEITP